MIRENHLHASFHDLDLYRELLMKMRSLERCVVLAAKHHFYRTTLGVLCFCFVFLYKYTDDFLLYTHRTVPDLYISEVCSGFNGNLKKSVDFICI